MEQVGQGIGISPARFGRYILLDRLGKGGMAEVFRAIMPGAEGFTRTLVVKRILPRFSESAEFVDMFVREARIGALLNHPNIVQVYDFGSVDGRYFLAMEYLRGRDVLAIIRRLCELKRPFPVPAAAFIAHEVARCLGYAHALAGPDGHSLDIVHRDVSPSNIMCLREGGVKLLDFGIAKAAGELSPDETQEGSFKGKLAYMAPERLHHRPIDGRADLYAVGVVLWEMLTCRRLFAGRDEVETLKNVLEMPVAPPSSRRPGIPPRLDDIVLRALARDPARRYPTGQALAEGLEQILRETEFKPSILPQLLVDLFGTGLRSTQIALTSLAPELLAESGDPAGRSTGTGSLCGSMHPVPPVRARSWRAPALLGSLLAAAVVLVVLGASPWHATRRAASSPPVVTRAAVTAPVPTATSAPTTRPTKPAAAAKATPASQAEPAAPPQASGPLRPAAATALGPAPAVPQVSASPPAPEDPVPVSPTRTASPEQAAKARPAGLRKKAAGSRARSADNPIGSGLSIDPFAEAATKGRR